MPAILKVMMDAELNKRSSPVDKEQVGIQCRRSSPVDKEEVSIQCRRSSLVDKEEVGI